MWHDVCRWTTSLPWTPWVSGMLVRMMLRAVQRINLLLYKVAFDSLPVFDLWLSDSSPMMTSFLVYDLPQTEMGYCWFEMLCGKSHIVDCSRADYVAWLCIVISYMNRLNKHAPGICWQGAEQSYWRQSSLFKTARRMACLLMDASIIVKHLEVYSGMVHRHLE